jgi:hypothetical protein
MFIALTLFGSLILPFSALARAEPENPRLPVNQNNIYSISVKPDSPTGQSNYILKIFADERESKQIAMAIRPLEGKITDVEIYDIDKDGTDELVVKMVENISTSSRVHFDVFEFDGKKLSWIDEFKPVATLFNLFARLKQ